LRHPGKIIAGETSTVTFTGFQNSITYPRHKPIVESMDETKLPMHPAFLCLSERGRKKLMMAAELWEAPAGSQLFHPGDLGEEIILVLQGRLESQDNKDVRRNWLKGDLWGEARLGIPQPLEYTLRAVEYTRWLRWTRASLLELCSKGAIRRALKPRYDSKGRLRTGFSRSLQPNSAPGNKQRIIRPSARPAILVFALAILAALSLYITTRGVATISPLIILCSPAVFLPWLCIFGIRNLSTLYKIEADSIISRCFDWKSLAIETRHIPTDQIQGVSIDQGGTMNNLLKIGTIRVKTAALDGELILKNINSPGTFAQEIQKLRKLITAKTGGREREKMRRNLEDSGLGEYRPRMLRSVQDNKRLARSTTLKIRKSPVVLVSQILLPVVLSVIISLLSITRGLHFATVIPMFIWIAYRFEAWRNDFFLASQGYVTSFHRKPFGRKILRHQIKISSLQNIRTEQKGILSLIFGYGSLVLVTTGGAADITLKNVSNPQRFQEMLFEYREYERQHRERAQNTEQLRNLTQLAHALRQIQVS